MQNNRDTSLPIQIADLQSSFTLKSAFLQTRVGQIAWVKGLCLLSGTNEEVLIDA